jgi:hypothetical protein
MDAGQDRGKRRVDLGSLRIGRRYRVDRKNEELRRSFRFIGTLVSIETLPPGSPEGDQGWLTFEVKPRFGRPTLQRVDVATVLAVVPVMEPDN